MRNYQRLRLATLGIMLTGLVTAGCATPRTAHAPAPDGAGPLITPGQQFVPACKIEGCCEGHGTVAYVQPDKFVMCTDGSPSQLCDCH